MKSVYFLLKTEFSKLSSFKFFCYALLLVLSMFELCNEFLLSFAQIYLHLQSHSLTPTKTRPKSSSLASMFLLCLCSNAWLHQMPNALRFLTIFSYLMKTTQCD